MHGNGGIWQVSKIAFRTLWTLEHINVYRENNYDQIWTAFGRLESCGSRQALISTQHLLLDSTSPTFLAAFIPPANQIEKQVEYWKIHYMPEWEWTHGSVC